MSIIGSVALYNTVLKHMKTGAHFHFPSNLHDFCIFKGAKILSPNRSQGMRFTYKLIFSTKICSRQEEVRQRNKRSSLSIATRPHRLHGKYGNTEADVKAMLTLMPPGIHARKRISHFYMLMLTYAIFFILFLVEWGRVWWGGVGIRVHFNHSYFMVVCCWWMLWCGLWCGDATLPPKASI